MRCLICGNALDESTVCPRCGFDLSRDREQHPTLSNDGSVLTAAWCFRDKMYQSSQRDSAACPICGFDGPRDGATASSLTDVERQPEVLRAVRTRLYQELRPLIAAALSASAPGYAETKTQRETTTLAEPSKTPPRETHSPRVDPASEIPVIKRGKINKNLTWELNQAGKLKICGDGELDIRWAQESPWARVKDRILHVEIEEGVTSVGQMAFDGCDKLNSVSLPTSVCKIEAWSFYGCSSLRQIKIPQGVPTIAVRAFEYCEALTSITIPESVTIIDNSAFDYCEKLKDVYYTGTEQQWRKIWVKMGNNAIETAAVHYNCTP